MNTIRFVLLSEENGPVILDSFEVSQHLPNVGDNVYIGGLFKITSRTFDYDEGIIVFSVV